MRARGEGEAGGQRGGRGDQWSKVSEEGEEGGWQHVGGSQCWCPGNSCPPTGALSGPETGSGVFSAKTLVAHCK